MIKEYGIDPEALDSAESFYRVTSFFGIEKWRLIRKFPGNWEAKVRQSLRNASPREKLRLYDNLQNISKQLIECNNSRGIITYTYDEKIIWIMNAEKYHLIFPFHGAVSSKNPNSLPFVCKVDELSEGHPIISNASCYKVKREAPQMAECVKPLLSNAQEIHFVDRLFENRGIEGKYLRPLKEFLRNIFQRDNHTIKPLKRIVYHTSDRTLSANLQSCLNREISPLLKNGLSLEIIRWPFADMHNRFILSELGGVTFQEGLDDWNNGTGREYDDISPLSAEACKLKCSENSVNSYMLQPFNHTKDIKIL